MTGSRDSPLHILEMRSSHGKTFDFSEMSSVFLCDNCRKKEMWTCAFNWPK